MSAEADLDAIVEALVEQRLAHLAASVRTDQGQMVPRFDEPYYIDPRYLTPEQVLLNRGMRRVPAPQTAYHDDSLTALNPWYHNPRYWVVIAGVTAVLGLITAVVVWVTNAITNAPSDPGGALTALIAIAVIIGTVLLLANRRKGRQATGRAVTGTFSGRCH